MSYKVRAANLADMKSILSLIQELADFEKEPDAVEISLNELKEDFKNNRFNCFVAEQEKVIVGMALYYNRYSTWKGKTIHLEDLIVKQSHRNKGIGKTLLNKLISLAKKEKIRRVEWCVLDWNKPAITFYENSGANVLKDWYLVQLNRKEIEDF